MRWYEERRPGLGSEFVGAVDDLLARIGDRPHQFPVWLSNARFRRALVNRFPFSLFFHVVDEVPVVVAVAHTSRRPGYWLVRTGETKENP